MKVGVCFSGLVQNALLEGQIYQFCGWIELGTSVRLLSIGVFFLGWWLECSIICTVHVYVLLYWCMGLLLLVGGGLDRKGGKSTVCFCRGCTSHFVGTVSVDVSRWWSRCSRCDESIDWLFVVGQLWGASPEMFRERHAIALGLSIVFGLSIQFLVVCYRNEPSQSGHRYWVWVGCLCCLHWVQRRVDSGWMDLLCNGLDIWFTRNIVDWFSFVSLNHLSWWWLS